MIELELPFPPSLNHYYRRVGPRTLISREGRAFRKRVCAIVAAAGVEPMTGPLHVDIKLYPPDRRRRDVDNSLKSLLDGLEHGGAYHDDGQISSLKVERLEPVAGGQTTVRIENISAT